MLKLSQFIVLLSVTIQRIALILLQRLTEVEMEALSTCCLTLETTCSEDF